jgi:hypothetical protein
MDNNNNSILPTNQDAGRDNKGRFVKGISGNPKGINGGRKPVVELYEALERACVRHNKSFIEHLIDRAYKNDTVAIALAKKLLPDQIEEVGEAAMHRIINIITYKKEDYDRNNTSAEV